MPIHCEWTCSIFKQKYSTSSKFDTFLKQRFICRLVSMLDRSACVKMFNTLHAFIVYAELFKKQDGTNIDHRGLNAVIKTDSLPLATKDWGKPDITQL